MLGTIYIYIYMCENSKYLMKFRVHILYSHFHLYHGDLIGGGIVSVLTSSAVDRRFEPRSGQTKDYQIGICCFSAKYAALRRKSKDGLARNQNNVSKLSDMSSRCLSELVL